MTQQLHRNEVRLFRALRRTGIVLMVLLRLDRPVGEVELAEILGVHPETMRIYLRMLAELGMVTRIHRYHGWTLAAGGRQMVLGQAGEGRAPAGSEVPPNAGVSLPSGKINASAENPSSKTDASSRWRRSSVGPGANGRANLVYENMEAFAAIGLAQNKCVAEVCQMAHVTPEYIRGQKRRLEAERRYSHGLLLTVVRCKDQLPAEYLPRVYRDSYTDHSESEPEPDEGQVPEDDVGEEEDADASIPRIEPDPSIHEPMSANGMTAARAWEAAREQLPRGICPRGRMMGL